MNSEPPGSAKITAGPSASNSLVAGSPLPMTSCCWTIFTYRSSASAKARVVSPRSRRPCGRTPVPGEKERSRRDGMPQSFLRIQRVVSGSCFNSVGIAPMRRANPWCAHQAVPAVRLGLVEGRVGLLEPIFDIRHLPVCLSGTKAYRAAQARRLLEFRRGEVLADPHRHLCHTLQVRVRQDEQELVT